MNAPLPDSIREALERVSLDDKYTLETGRAFMSGVQALVRLPMLQRTRDAIAGLDTAGFISGYRGSPLGGYDQALWSAKKLLAAQNIVFAPGVNEELAATAVWGTQQLALHPRTNRFDGVFGLWYGKGPGVDRTADVFKHANMAGTAATGGVIAIAGDDHVAKSSTAAHQSDHIFKACGMPVFFPSSVQDILDMGLHAFALSRFSGLWSAMKTIQEIVESAAGVDVDPRRVRIALPSDFTMPAGGVHIRWPDTALEQEARMMDTKWYAALAYIRANRLNHDVVATPHDRFGLIASGKAFNDLRQALVDLGLDDDRCRELGIRVHKVNVVWPLEATLARDFAQGLEEILVVEEKRQVIEYQLKEQLYNWRSDVRPTVVGKFDEQPGGSGGGEWGTPNPGDHWLLRPKADLTPALVARAVARRLEARGMPAEVVRRMHERLAVIDAKERALIEVRRDPAAQVGDRTPWFCSGCPHNTSTRVPEGSRAVAGIGCHYMVNWMDRATSTFTQMGGEGVPWVGQSPFTTETHIFANLGDGTYYHSGLLAIRQALSAQVNITYKILFNGAVAMTGGQPVDGQLDVASITRELEAEGVKRLLVVSDQPGKYQADARLAPGTTVHHRDELDALQRELREVAGVSVIVYDQTCATEKRRRRKRGTMAPEARRVVVNEAVCEGCGDCSVQSNCLSVEPVETEFGRKRRINQNTCNQDFSCANGFCPSFVSVEGTLKKAASAAPRLAALPEVPMPVLPEAVDPWGIVVAGIGGTGVITIGQLLGMAAHLEGKGVVTQDSAGLAQKGGGTWSHIQIAATPAAILTTKVDTAKADVVIGCEAITAANPATLAVMREGRTYVALNTHASPTSSFVQDPDWQFPASQCETAIRRAVGDGLLGAFDADQVATRLLGDSIFTNPLMLGYAWQQGRIPVGHAALMRAMALNGVQVEKNQAAFEWGRRCAHDLPSVRALFQAAQVIAFAKKPSLDATIARREAFLSDYQDAAYAAAYRRVVDAVRAAEAPLGGTRLADTVARNLFKLMAYKDEYEVARLHADPAFRARLAEQFDGEVKLRYHLAPPLLARKNARGEPVKQTYGGWMLRVFGLLARFKRLRGTPFDPFGHTAERRTERALVVEYRALVVELLASLDADRIGQAVALAALPQEIRGYGHVKARHLAAVRAKKERLLHAWRAAGTIGAKAA